jgi:signal transduction histidine kinase
VTFLRAIFEEQVPKSHRVHCPSSEFLVDFDPSLLKEALGELILNARKSIGDTRPLQMSASVAPLTVKGLPWCRVDIRDNGPGIPKDKRDRVFEELFSEWPQSEVRGTGLGLSFVTSIIAEHGGFISAIESDSGACLRIEFPRYSAGKVF